MTINNFLAYNLRVGDKVRLTLSIKDGITKEIVAFFQGFRILFGQHIGSADNLYPVFCKVAKNGKMSRYHTDEYTGLNEILSIENLNDSSYVELDKFQGLLNASHVTEEYCEKLVINILKELDSLFPGKWLCLYDNPFNAAFWEEHAGIATGINARPFRIRYAKDNDKDTFVLDVDCDTYTQTVLGSENNLEYRPLHMLNSVISAITFPTENFGFNIDGNDENRRSKYIDLVSLGHDGIPIVTNEQPVLLHMGLIEAARINLWWRHALTTEQRIGLFKEKLTFEDAQKRWDSLPLYQKSYYYNSWNNGKQ